MEKMWTPLCLPPSSNDLTELSFSALKIISHLQNPNNFKLNKISNEENSESWHYDDLWNVSGLNKSPKTFSCQKNYPSNYINPTINCVQEELFYEPSFTSLNSYNMNESVDMFEDSSIINSVSNVKSNIKSTLQPESKKQNFDCFNLSLNGNKKSFLPQNKITDYFPAGKRSVNHAKSGKENYGYDKYGFPTSNSCNNLTEFATHSKKKLKTKMKNRDEPNKRSLPAPLKNCKHSEKKMTKDLNCSISDLCKHSIDVSDPFAPTSSKGLSTHNLDNSHGNNLKHMYRDKLQGSSVLIDHTDLKENNNKVKQPDDILYLNQDNFETANKILFSAGLAEIGFTICYREGFCLLNKPTVKQRCNTNGILMRVAYSDNCSKHIFFPPESFKEENLKMIMINILNSSTQKICYETQALILYLLDNIALENKRVCYDWSILDPLVAVWLLDPDNPQNSFEGILKLTCLSKQSQEGDTWLSKCCTFLKYQSQVMEYLSHELRKSGLWELFYSLETNIVPMLSVLETSNIIINVEILKTMSTILQRKLNLLEKEAETIVGHRFSLKSPLQIRKVLFEELKLDQNKQITTINATTKGEKSTSESMLKLLGHDHPLPRLILEYRQLSKLKSSYVDIILQLADEKQSVSATWELCATATGRITSSNPNLQGIPKRSIVIEMEEKRIEFNLRSCFVAQKGYIFIGADFQHIELRMLAHLSKDKTLTDLLKKRDDVFNSISQVRLKKIDISEEDRNQTKTLVYALMYGAGSKKLANILSVSESKVEEIKNNLFEIFPCFRNFQKKILDEVRNTKILKSLSGRRRLFPDIVSNNLAQRMSAERKAINFIIQGSAADICKFTMLKIEKRMKNETIKGRLVLQIHDELLWEVETSSCQNMISLVNAVMDENMQYWSKEFNIEIPLPLVITSGHNWGNMK